jgi:23S rRNA (pseudouridine1915-N3)-methyltransferase
MRIHILTVAGRQPAWVQEGYREYATRLRGGCRLDLVELPLGRRRAADIQRAIIDEGRRLLAALPSNAHAVALEVGGQPWDTAALGQRLEAWTALGRPIAVLIGGPDGLSDECLERSAERWSLSRLTLPHGLVRVVVAEALYRAWSVRQGHPYHRA